MNLTKTEKNDLLKMKMDYGVDTSIIFKEGLNFCSHYIQKLENNCDKIDTFEFANKLIDLNLSLIDLVSDKSNEKKEKVKLVLKINELVGFINENLNKDESEEI